MATAIAMCKLILFIAGLLVAVRLLYREWCKMIDDINKKI